MQSKQGIFNGFRAVRYSDGSVFYQVGGSWYRALGQEDSFIPFN